MVPFTVVEYYGDIAGNFTANGIGIEAAGWDKVYLCNGLNGTPDKRGRSPIGSTSALMGGGALDPIVAAGPSYGLRQPGGTPYVTLITAQLPSHTHPNLLSFNDPGHIHAMPNNVIPLLRQLDDGGQGNTDDLWQGYNNNVSTLSSKTGITCTLTNVPQGDNQPHNNTHPVISCYYIMYIP
jgi:microcystin-dependent protein